MASMLKTETRDGPPHYRSEKERGLGQACDFAILCHSPMLYR